MEAVDDGVDESSGSEVAHARCARDAAAQSSPFILFLHTQDPYFFPPPWINLAAARGPNRGTHAEVSAITGIVWEGSGGEYVLRVEDDETHDLNSACCTMIES